ncbi:MAG: sigma-54-dependent Fis family transcriptional regulator [Bacteroidales bacterium]|nr:sigma-54-dependent Fis family transcriptional regulator [Bacteroidales bacterium]
MKKAKEKILYIDDTAVNLRLFEEVFQDKYETYSSLTPGSGFEILSKKAVKVVFVDLFMPEMTGLEFIEKASVDFPDCIYIIITAYPEMEVAINAINQGGVYRFFTKPWDKHEVEMTIKNAIETYDLRIHNQKLIKDLEGKNTRLFELKEKLEEENLYLHEEIRLNSNFENIISKDVAFKKVLKDIEQVSDTMATVLILGETGTGKELVARAIHEVSKRSSSSFIKVNCATIPESLIESELFGHEKGAFTGAVRQKKGKFELAHKGTIFLDEIGEMPLHLQPKLLQVLQDGEFSRVGGTSVIHVDVRVVAATNRNLDKMIESGQFRTDLFYRLNVFPMLIPPLRERRSDIPLLANYFIGKFNRLIGKRVEMIPVKAMDLLMSHDWPGNIRELENTIERAVIVSKGSKLELKDRFISGKDSADSGVFLTLQESEKEYIIKVLERTNWRVSGPKGAASILGMNPTTLESRLKKLGITKP